MLKKVLTEIDLYSGNILMPDGFDINRTQIKHDIIKSFSTNKRMSDNTKDYSYQDYQLPFSKPVGWLNDYIRDHFKVEYGSTLVLKSQFGCIYKPEQQAYSRHNIDPIDLKNAPDYTFIYGVDVAKDSCELVIEYNDNRRAGRTWHLTMKNNFFALFPSTQKYFITPNTSKQLNIFLTSTYVYI